MHHVIKLPSYRKSVCGHKEKQTQRLLSQPITKAHIKNFLTHISQLKKSFIICKLNEFSSQKHLFSTYILRKGNQQIATAYMTLLLLLTWHPHINVKHYPLMPAASFYFTFQAGLPTILGLSIYVFIICFFFSLFFNLKQKALSLITIQSWFGV